MKIPRLRFTMRRMMILVAVVAFLIGGWIEAARLQRLRAAHLHDVAYHTRRAVEELHNVANFDLGLRSGATNTNDRSMLLLERSSRITAEYHAQLKQKYLRAADRPWQAVPPDPQDSGEELLWESLRIPDIEFP